MSLKAVFTVFHINRNVSKVFKMCGFIKRVCTFTDVQALRSLYISLVRNQLDNCSVIWNRWKRILLTKSKRIKTVIEFLCYKSTILYSTYMLCHHFRLPSLQHHRQVADLIFLHKCVHSYLDSTYLVGNILYHCPSTPL